MNKEVEEASRILVEKMKEDADYISYLQLSEKLEADPELKARVDAFRRKNYHLQLSEDDIFQELYELDREYAEICKNPLVHAYLEAEVSVCRMIQDIMDYVKTEIRVPEL